jgi:hypothetical protein
MGLAVPGAPFVFCVDSMRDISMIAAPGWGHDVLACAVTCRPSLAATLLEHDKRERQAVATDPAVFAAELRGKMPSAK